MPLKNTDGNALDLAAIAPVLNAGFRAVLDEAYKRGVLDPPYGRTPMPDPNKITEHDPLGSSEDRGGRGGADEDEGSAGTDLASASMVDTERGGDSKEGAGENDEESDDGGDDDAKLLEYKFDYGFNPLVFLGEYIHRNNPAAIRARREKFDTDLLYLQQRAAKCLGREAAMVELLDLATHRRSGIVHGPIAGEITDCGAIVWAKAFRPGQLVVELSRHEDFHTVCRQGVTKVDQATVCAGTVEFDDLEPNMTWHQRAYLHYPRKGFDGPSAGFCVNGKFSTLPEPDADSDESFGIVAFSVRGLGRVTAATEHRDDIEAACAAVMAVDPKICVVLGEPATQVARRGRWEGFREVQETAARIPKLSQLLNMNGYLTASGTILEGQNKWHKQEKLVPACKTPESGGFDKTKPTRGKTWSEGERIGSGDVPQPYWPVRCSEAWGSRTLGSSVEMFLIDARGGVLGEDQLVWVTDAVEECTRTWKVIACGVPVGYPFSCQDLPVAIDTSSAKQHAAALKIQTSMRNRLESKAAKKAGQVTSPQQTTGGIVVIPYTAEDEGADATVERDGITRSMPSVSKPTSQMQEMVSKLHARGCSNVVLITPARSCPHALSLFGGHEAEGRFPVHELGCSALLRYPATPPSYTEDADPLTPCKDLETVLLMPELDVAAPYDGGLACSLGFGKGEGGEELSFEVCDGNGQRVAALNLRAV